MSRSIDLRGAGEAVVSFAEPKRTTGRREMSQQAYSVSVVVPVYNEEESLEPLQSAIDEAMKHAPVTSYEVIYIDDGSTDRSMEALRKLYAADPEHVHVIALRRNYGQSSAMGAGFDAATGEVVIPMDADLQNDPADISRLLEKVSEGYDVVSGWRKDRQDKAISRKLPSMIANSLISRMTGVHLHDYGCSLKAYRREIAQDIRLYGELHRFLPALAYWNGASVTELAVTHHARRFGTSKYGIGRTLTVILDLMTVRFLLSYATRPMQVFGRWALLSAVLAVTTTGVMIVQKVMPPHQDMTGSPLLYVSILLFLAALQLFGLGLLSEVSVRTYFESQDKRAYRVREQLRAKRSGE